MMIYSGNVSLGFIKNFRFQSRLQFGRNPSSNSVSKIEIGSSDEKKERNLEENGRYKRRNKKQIEREYAEFKETKAIIDKVKALLNKYGTSENIPLEELNPQKTGNDDATLLAFYEIFESKPKGEKGFH